MKHNIRQRVINSIGLPVTKIEQVNGELGSGVLDKNGKEIFEGDIVKMNSVVPYLDGVTPVEVTAPVVFKDGALCLLVKPENGEKDEFGLPAEDLYLPLQDYPSNCYEIVGHVDD